MWYGDQGTRGRDGTGFAHAQVQCGGDLQDRERGQEGEAGQDDPGRRGRGSRLPSRREQGAALPSGGALPRMSRLGRVRLQQGRAGEEDVQRGLLRRDGGDAGFHRPHRHEGRCAPRLRRGQPPCQDPEGSHHPSPAFSQGGMAGGVRDQRLGRHDPDRSRPVRPRRGRSQQVRRRLPPALRPVPYHQPGKGLIFLG